MSAIRSNTTPEITVRKTLHADGFRFRLHSASLPGQPDLVLTKYHAVVMVNGCFWHAHECSAFRWPATRADFWKAKVLRNRLRDSQVKGELRTAGWRTAIVWECSLIPVRRADTLRKLEELLRGNGPELELSE